MSCDFVVACDHIMDLHTKNELELTSDGMYTNLTSTCLAKALGGLLC